ncbi:cytochrome P450 4V2 [Tetranychus urticae]|uniref:Cytochrome P450 n=1 Tax=Tetranychus urticae TaxID=32264 RepID=T1KXD8_TETUR|nr:cytochrome P450 4V2 [Tetranychus urticae]
MSGLLHDNVISVNQFIVKLIGITIIYYLFTKIVYFFKWFNRFHRFPSEPSSFLFGHALKFIPSKASTFIEKLTQFIERNVKANRDKSGLFAIWITWKPMICCCSHQAIEAVMSKTNITKPSFYKFFGLKDGLVTSNPTKWKLRRKMVEPFFVSKQQKLFINTMNHVFDKLVNQTLVELSIRGQPVNLHSYIHQSMLDIIINATLHIPMESRKSEKKHIIDTIDLIEKAAYGRIFNPVLWFNSIFSSTKLGKKFIKDTNIFYDFLTTQINSKLDNNSNVIESRSQESLPCDLVSLLMQTSGGDIDINGINEELVTIICAGHETTSVSLNWTLFVLGNCQDVQEKLYREISSVFHESGQMNDLEKINQCHYLDMCLRESLRLYPPIAYVFRDLDEDASINKDYTIPKGTTVLINILSAHRDPQVYPNPDDYIPERFDNTNKNNIPKGSFLPFGFSPRNCVGYRFALIEMKIFIIHILRRFRVESTKKLDDVQYIVEFALKPTRPLDFILHERSTQ